MVRPLRLATFYLFAVFLSGCGSQQFRLANDGTSAGVPRYVELLREKQVANLHFPAGLYSLYATDNKGFYYRAPYPIRQNTDIGAVSRNGGVYVSRRNNEKIRGYIFFAGALTHVGDLSKVPHRFRE